MPRLKRSHESSLPTRCNVSVPFWLRARGNESSHALFHLRRELARLGLARVIFAIEPERRSDPADEIARDEMRARLIRAEVADVLHPARTQADDGNAERR